MANRIANQTARGGPLRYPRTPRERFSLYCLSRVMSDPKELRARATRLFALALAAREQGMDAYANEVTKLASDALAEAEKIEQHDAD